MGVRVYVGAKKPGEYLLTDRLEQVPEDILSSFGTLTVRPGEVDLSGSNMIGADPEEIRRELSQAGYFVTKVSVTFKETTL